MINYFQLLDYALIPAATMTLAGIWAILRVPSENTRNALMDFAAGAEIFGVLEKKNEKRGRMTTINPTAIIRALILFVLAGLAEIGGGYLVWQWLREGKAIWLGVIGGAILFLYGIIPTLQTEPAFGRVYAAYGGIFVILSILWGMVFDGWKPDRFDLIGAAVALVGVSITMWGRLFFR